MKRDLFLRTDVLPEEIPMLFSNKNVYLNFSEAKVTDEYRDISLWTKGTVPLFFGVPKGENNETRQIALIHPLAQIQVFRYIVKFEQLIIAHSQKSQYSVRAPIKRNFPKLLKNTKKEKEYKKIQQEYGFVNKFPITTDEDLMLFENYFSFNRHKQLKGLIDSPNFRRTQYKFNYFRKLDIQNFFPSIYTHSLSWALFGSKALGKKYSKKKYEDVFPNQTDRIMQQINFNETNGIVVGPEFSRIISELLLVDVDTKLFSYLESKNLFQPKNYIIYRFIDDYFIFADEPGDIDLIENKLKKLLTDFNLTLNTYKSDLQERPFKISNGSISELRTVISEFEQSKLLSVHQRFNEEISLEEKINSTIYDVMPLKIFKGTHAQWNDLFIKLELLIDRYPSDKAKITHYFLKAIRYQVNFDGNQIVRFNHILEIISNIFTLNITTKSTNHLIAICFKILYQLRSFEDEFNKKNCELTVGDYNTKNNITNLKEALYHHLFRVMKNNLSKMEYMYDLLVFIKSLDKKLPASFLSTMIEKHRDSYFVLCSIGYYILDKELNELDPRYITVRTKLYKSVNDLIKNYKSNGIENDQIIFESSYFYLLNDFSKYPGFEQKSLRALNKTLNRAWEMTIHSNEEQKAKVIEVWKHMVLCQMWWWNIIPPPLYL